MSLTLRTEHNLHYITKPPRCVSQVRFRTGVELYTLIQGRKVWKAGNIELRDGLPLLIYSPYSKRWWYRILRKDHNIREYRRYIKDGTLSIYFNDHWQGVVKEEVEKEGMGYFKYNELRELLLIEPTINRSLPDYYIKKRAIDTRIKQLRDGRR